MTRGLGGNSPANISFHLKGIDFPTDKRGLLKQAKKNGAERAVMETIMDMEDHDFQNMADVMKAYGESHRHNNAA